MIYTHNAIYGNAPSTSDIVQGNRLSQYFDHLNLKMHIIALLKTFR